MASYNLVLLPQDEAVQDALYASAAALQGLERGYRLQPNSSFPHITLAQFTAATEDHALERTHAFLGESFTVRLRGITMHLGTDAFAGRYWTQYDVIKEPSLIALQERAVAAVTSATTQTHMKTGLAYGPHVTLALLGEKPASLPLACLDPALLHTDIACTVALGLSDECFQLVRVLRPQKSPQALA